MPRLHEPEPTDHAGRLPVWALGCFIASGAAGLLYEVVWSKQLSYLLGNSLHSVATVVAAFLAGLALGAWVLGTRLARLRRGARIYAVLEIGIALFGVASMLLLRGLDPLVGTLYRGLGGEGPAFAAARFGVLFLLLLPPTVLMGATLPVLVGHFEYRRVGPALARLYAINTAGAVLGSIAAGFILLPTIGLTLTTMVAALLNGAAAMAAWLASHSASTNAPSETSASEPTPAPVDPIAGARSTTRFVVIAMLFALSGFAALALQIAWVRLFGLLFGSSVYSFSAVLAVYLGGLALGSACVAPMLGRGRGLLAFFGALQLAIGVVGLAGIHLFRWLPEWFYRMTLHAGDSWPRFYAGELALVFGMLIVPCVALGAVFPVAARLLQRRDGGHATGVAYAVNSVGTLAGSLLAGFALIPRLGVQGTQLVAAMVSLAAGLVAIVLARRAAEVGPRGLGLAAAALGLGLALMSTTPPWDSALMSAGLYRPVETRKVTAAAGATGPAVFGSTRAERTLFYREGVNGSVYVASDSTGRYRWLKVGGKTDASTGDMLTQVLLGVLPGAIAPPGGRAAVIGLGSGITLQALLATGVGPVDVMEIEPAVVEASRFFDEPGHHPLDDPRVTLVLSDARTHLVHAGRTWDVIVSEPSNPWIAGVNGLFTVDFYRRLRRSLAPDGVFCQWMQLYELSPETLGSMLGSFLEVFPSGHAFFVRGSEDLLLVTAPAGRTLTLERLRTPAVRHQLERARQLGPESVAAWYACPFDSLRALAAGVPLNRDDRPVVEYRAPRDLYRVGRAGGTPPGVSRVPSARWEAAHTLLAGWTEENWYEGRARQLARSGEHALALAEARAASRAGLPALGAALERGIEEDRVSRAVVVAQEEARRAAATGHAEQSRDALRRAVALDPSDGRTWVLLAETLRRLGDPQGAREAAGRAHAVGRPDDRADACVVEGLIAIAEGRAREAAAEFQEAQRWMPRRTRLYVFEAEALRTAGDPVAAAAACRRGLAAAADRTELEALLRALGSATAAQTR